MIPVPYEELKPYNTADEKDLKYREVILGELRFIQKNTEKIIFVEVKKNLCCNQHD